MRIRRFFGLDLTPVVYKLLVANGAVWGVQIVFGLSGSSLVEDWFAFDPEHVLPWRPWQFFTYMFLHSTPGPAHVSGFLHIFMNMLMLLVFGSPVEQHMGSRRFWRYYVVCGVAGAVLTLIPPFRAITIGASGAVLGVLVAFGLLYPDTPVFAFFFFPALPAKFVVFVLAVVNVLSAVLSTRGGIAYMAHVGGMAAGYCMLRGVPLAGRLRRRWAARSAAEKRRRRQEVREKLDAILDKMHEQGKDSLSRDEWNILLEASRRRHDD